MKKNLLAMVAVALLAGPIAANAVIITINDTSGNNNTDVSGEMDFTINATVPGEYRMNFLIRNTSDAALTTRLTGVAFDLLGAGIFGFTRPTGWDFGTDATLPGESLTFDACFYSGPNCGAGGNEGLTTADGWLGGFSVFFVFSGGDAATLQQQYLDAYNAGTMSACMRFVSIGAGDDSDVACNGTPTSVPEPGTLALFGLGLAGLGFARRRRATN